MKKSRKIWWTALACTTLTCGVIGLTGCFNFNAGDNSGDSSAEEHTHEYHCEVISPTCTEGGENVYSCSCGDNRRRCCVCGVHLSATKLAHLHKPSVIHVD